ncbi:hypothetical protein LTR94_022933 [Friedmanniomyces endolithicus]|nr:hypothetical protein LTR94_022933 [Friedmanniomyces endolithicus]
MADAKTNLIATKTLRYGTRRLMADDGFQARPRDARLLVAIGKARYATEDAKPAAEPVADDLAGKKPYHGWDADTLRAKIAEG